MWKLKPLHMFLNEGIVRFDADPKKPKKKTRENERISFRIFTIV